jgi:hypothetical protein
MPVGRLERLKTICTEQRECLGTQDTRPETDINPSGLLRAVRRKIRPRTVNRESTNNLALAVSTRKGVFTRNPKFRSATRADESARDDYGDRAIAISKASEKPRGCGKQQRHF